MDLKATWRFFDPYKTMIASLVILAIINAGLVGLQDAALSTIVSVAFSLGTDTKITYFKTKKWIFSYGPAISGLVLALVFSPNFPLYYVAATAVLAQTLKHLVRYNGNNIFNPASLAMFIVFFFVPAEAWWGNRLYEALALGLIVSWRIKRLPGSMAFLAAYAIFSMLLGQFAGDINNGGFGQYVEKSTAWIFFALFMLVEPRTSPRGYRAQIIYGALIAAVSVLGFRFGLHSPILLALLAGNAAAAFYLNSGNK